MQVFKPTLLLACGWALAACGGENSDMGSDTLAEAPTPVMVETAPVQEIAMPQQALVQTASLEEEIAGPAYTREAFMESCTAGDGVSEAQCGCVLDFYAARDVEIADMTNADAMGAFLDALAPDDVTEMAACLQ